ncbi:ABC transporter permease [Desulfitibacter alkalitolerans]|uniref:ABC transporter permease n=1 Tax=Desulfitibacter alkalitolerans TaxID=264641 RepID=UPI000A04DF85|nr:ABC transporter permease [Desulfitibacter alkalitolerans]
MQKNGNKIKGITTKIFDSQSYIIAVAVLLVIWWVVSVLINKPVLPTPGAALLEFYFQLQMGLVHHAWVSFYRIGVSLFLALVIGVPLGILLGTHKRLDSYIAPMVYLTYPIPKIVFLPVLLILLGYGDSSKIFLITLIVFYQILVTTRDAARGIDPGLIMSVKSLGAGYWHLYFHVYFLGCLPEILTALRVALGTAIAVLFIAEAYATQEGLGYFIMDSMGRFNYSRMFAGIIGMALLGFFMYIVIDLFEKVFCRWKHLKK